MFNIVFSSCLFLIFKFFCEKSESEVQDNEEVRRQIRFVNISEDRFGPDSVTTINQAFGLSNIRFRNSPRNRQRNSRYLVHPSERSNTQRFMRPRPPRPSRINIPENRTVTTSRSNRNISRTSRLPVRPVNRIISSRTINPTTIQVRPTRIVSSRSISSNSTPERNTRIISSRSITIPDIPSNSNEESQNTELKEVSINIENNNSPFLSSPRPSIISSRHTNRYIEYRSNSQSPYMVNSDSIVNNLSPLRLERFRSPNFF